MAMVKPHVSLQPPSTGIVFTFFTKYPSVMDSLCNHKKMATRWADSEQPTCACSILQPHLTSKHQESEHVALDGDTLKFDLQPLTSIATGSLQNKIFPPKKEIFKLFLTAFRTWQRKNAMPSISKTNLQELWSTAWPQHTGQISSHITHRDIVKFQTTFPGAVFPNEDKCATSLRIYCPCLCFQCLTAAFSDPAVFRTIPTSPTETIHPTIEKIKKRFLKSYPLALGAGRDLPNAYVLPKQKRNLLWEGQSSASSHHHIDLCSTALRSSFTNSSRQLSHTSLLKVMYSNSSSNSRRLTLTT